MVKLIDMSIDGLTSFPGAKAIAAKNLQRRGDVDQAIEAIIRTHVLLASAQGVVTNLGGIVSAIVGTPVNVTGLLLVQTRMVACIAHLHGYDVDDPRVRTAIAMCLLGQFDLDRQISTGRLPSTPLAVATSPVHDPRLYAHVADRVLDHLLRHSGGKGLVGIFVRKVPVLGGGVGGLADFMDTHRVSHCARTQLTMRRV